MPGAEYRLIGDNPNRVIYHAPHTQGMTKATPTTAALISPEAAWAAGARTIPVDELPADIKAVVDTMNAGEACGVETVVILPQVDRSACCRRCAPKEAGIAVVGGKGGISRRALIHACLHAARYAHSRDMNGMIPPNDEDAFGYNTIHGYDPYCVDIARRMGGDDMMGAGN